MKKFFKILWKIIKILLKIILWLILWIIVISGIILLIINNRTLKFYYIIPDCETYDGEVICTLQRDLKFTTNESFKIKDWVEFKLKLKNLWGEIRTFEDWYLQLEKFLKLNFPTISFIKNLYKNWDIENFLDVLEYCYDSDYIRYYVDDRVKEKWQVVNWLKNWNFTSYYPNWQIEKKWNYINWLENWVFTWYYENWSIRYKWKFINWIPNWTFTWYFEDWNIQYIENGKNWKLDWKSIIYNKDWSYENIDADNGIWIRTVYGENDNIILKYWFITDEENNRLLNWKFINYFENWKITEWNYINWLKDWNRTWYYSDKSIRFLWRFENWSWIISYFDENWNLIWTWEHTYTNELFYWNWVYNEIINWLEIILYDNWQIKSVSNYSYWNLNWAQTWYYENGQIAFVCNYSDWPKDWPCTTYYENGQIREIWEYEKYTSLDWYVYELGKYSYYGEDWNLIWTWETICSEEYSDWCLKKRLWFYYTYYPSYKIHEIFYYTSGWIYTTWYFENWNIEHINNSKGIVIYYENWNLRRKYDENSLVEYFEDWKIYIEWNFKDWKRVWTRNRYLWDWSIWVSKNFDE